VKREPEKEVSLYNQSLKFTAPRMELKQLVTLENNILFSSEKNITYSYKNKTVLI
jgi:hypothetical protein